MDYCSSRLPIYQGASSSYLPIIYSVMNLPQWKCPQGRLNN